MSLPGRNMWSTKARRWFIAFLSTSIAFNVLITCGIAYRFLYMRKLVLECLPQSGGTTYTSIVTMIVESAAITTIVAIVFFICYIVDSPFQLVLYPVLTQAMVRHLSCPVTICSSALHYMPKCILVHLT